MNKTWKISEGYKLDGKYCHDVQIDNIKYIVPRETAVLAHSILLILDKIEGVRVDD